MQCKKTVADCQLDETLSKCLFFGYMLSFSEIKIGKVVLFNGKPCIVTKADLRQQPRLAAVKNVILKDLVTGSNYPKTFSASESVEEAELRKEKSNFMYANGDEYSFMTQSTYETVDLNKAILEDQIQYLKEGLEVSIVYFNDNPISLDIPVKISYIITEAAPAIKGNTATNITKDAVIETGKTIKVPGFIEQGEKVIVNTVDGEYLGRDTGN
jgi:elongation factor P